MIAKVVASPLGFYAFVAYGPGNLADAFGQRHDTKEQAEDDIDSIFAILDVDNNRESAIMAARSI